MFSFEVKSSHPLYSDDNCQNKEFCFCEQAKSTFGYEYLNKSLLKGTVEKTF